jgi:hypothetical protein
MALAAPARSPLRILWELGQDLGRRRGATVWLPLLGVAVAASAPAGRAGFPENRFPVRAVQQNAGWLAPDAGAPRILTSDQWGDYLIYRLYPRQRVFFDGRSDFYGADLAADYGVLQAGCEGWRERMARYRFDAALLPRGWPLSAALEREPGWRRVYQDSVAAIYRRAAGNGVAAP